jgi:hypothetical protein
MEVQAQRPRSGTADTRPAPRGSARGSRARGPEGPACPLQAVLLSAMGVSADAFAAPVGKGLTMRRLHARDGSDDRGRVRRYPGADVPGRLAGWGAKLETYVTASSTRVRLRAAAARRRRGDALRGAVGRTTDDSDDEGEGARPRTGTGP